MEEIERPANWADIEEPPEPGRGCSGCGKLTEAEKARMREIKAAGRGAAVNRKLANPSAAV